MGFDISCKLETISIKCQSLFSEKNNKNIISLVPAELAQIEEKVKNYIPAKFIFFKALKMNSCYSRM